MQRFTLRDGVDPQKYGIGIKELWQVAPEQPSAGARRCTARAGRSTTPTGGGSFIYHFGEQPRRGRLRRASRLRESAPVAVRRIPALQAASGDPADVRRRQADHVRRARDQRRRPAVGAAADVSRRRADRLRGGLRQPAADQGLAQCDEDRHAGCGSRVRRARRSARARRAARLRQRRGARRGCTTDLYKVRNVKPGLRFGMWAGTLHGGVHMWLNDLGLGALVPWTLRHRHADHESLRPAAGHAARSPIRNTTARSRSTSCRRCICRTRITKRTSRCICSCAIRRFPSTSICASTTAPKRAIVRRASTNSSTTRRGRRSHDDASPADQRAELRALQDLRHQGSATEHPLGAARRRRRTQLQRDVIGTTAKAAPEGRRAACQVFAPIRLLARFPVAVDGDRRSRRRRHLHAVLLTAIVVRHVPVIRVVVPADRPASLARRRL